MPSFDLRNIKIAEYTRSGNAVSYGTPESVGDAMNCNLELRFAEGRLYAESSLAEFIKKASGGTISIGVKYIPESAQQLMFGATATTRNAGSKTVNGLRFGAKDKSKYVGVAFYAPDMIDSVEKYTCVFVTKAMFGPPSMTYQTKGDSINFNTPTTSGEFLADDTDNQVLLETAVCDTVDDAVAWCEAVFKAGVGV